MTGAPTDPAAVLAQLIHAGGRTKPFGDVTVEEVRDRAGELRVATGWGPTARVGAVARAWAELAQRMEQEGARTVADLDPASIREQAERLWVVPPGGSLL
jgi:hypothetical protein